MLDSLWFNILVANSEKQYGVFIPTHPPPTTANKECEAEAYNLSSWDWKGMELEVSIL